MPSIESRENGQCVGLMGEGCYRGVYAVHRCEKHYRKWIRHGKPEIVKPEDEAFNEAIQAFTRWTSLDSDSRESRLELVAENLRTAFKAYAQTLNLRPTPPRFERSVEAIVAELPRDQRISLILRLIHGLDYLGRRKVGREATRLTPEERRARAKAAAQKRMQKHGTEYLKKLAAAGNATRWGAKKVDEKVQSDSNSSPTFHTPTG